MNTMLYLLLIFVSIVLLAGFLLLTEYEKRRGARFLAEHRMRLDQTVERVEFILAHVNLAMFLRDEIRHLLSRLGHDIAHLSLLVVRAIERLLTRLVRRLRTDPEREVAPRETAREFVKTLSDFKQNLQATHPEISAPTSRLP